MCHPDGLGFWFPGVGGRLKAHKHASTRKEDPIYCQYIGVVDVNPGEIRQHRDHIWKEVTMGYEPGMIDAGVVDWEPDGSPEGIYRYL